MLIKFVRFIFENSLKFMKQKNIPNLYFYIVLKKYLNGNLKIENKKTQMWAFLVFDFSIGIKAFMNSGARNTDVIPYPPTIHIASVESLILL